MFNAEMFRTTFRHHAGGVVVITLDAGAGPVGFTATSLASVSLTPPLISFAIGRQTSSWPHLCATDSVVVNFLSHDQGDIAATFATSNIDRFAPPLQWYRLATGEPVLTSSRRWLRCAIDQRVSVGDHELVVAEIVAAGGTDRSVPSSLVYHGGRFHPVGHA